MKQDLRLNSLIRNGNEIYLKEFKSLEQAKNYSRNIISQLDEKMEELEEAKKEIERRMLEVEMAKSKTTDYLLNVRG